MMNLEKELRGLEKGFEKQIEKDLGIEMLYFKDDETYLEMHAELLDKLSAKKHNELYFSGYAGIISTYYYEKQDKIIENLVGASENGNDVYNTFISTIKEIGVVDCSVY